MSCNEILIDSAIYLLKINLLAFIKINITMSLANVICTRPLSVPVLPAFLYIIMIEHQVDRPHPARLMYTIIARLPTGSRKRALQESAGPYMEFSTMTSLY